MAVVGVMRRPREGDQYERLRGRRNAKIQEEMLKLKVDWLKNKKGNVSFTDLGAGTACTSMKSAMRRCVDGCVSGCVQDPLYAWALPE